MRKKEETPSAMMATEYQCPACNKPMFAQWGNQMHPGNKDFGVTLFCIHGDPDARKHPQEVSGHGHGRSDDTMLENAYRKIQAKYCGAKLDNEGELLEVGDETPATPTPTAVAVKQPKKGKRKTKDVPPVVEPEDDAI